MVGLWALSMCHALRMPRGKASAISPVYCDSSPGCSDLKIRSRYGDLKTAHVFFAVGEGLKANPARQIDFE